MSETYLRALTRALTRSRQEITRGNSPETAHTLARHLVLAADAAPAPAGTDGGQTSQAILTGLEGVARVPDLPEDLAHRLRHHPDPRVRALGWKHTHASASVEEWNTAIGEESRNPDKKSRDTVLDVMAAKCPWNDLTDEATQKILGLRTGRFTAPAANRVVDAGWRPEAEQQWRRTVQLQPGVKNYAIRTAVVQVLLDGHLADIVNDPDVCELYRLSAACAYAAPAGRAADLLKEWGRRLDETGVKPNFGTDAKLALRPLRDALMAAPHGRAADLNEVNEWLVLRLHAGEAPDVVNMIADLCTGRPDEVFTRQVNEAGAKQLDGLRLAWARLPQEFRTDALCRHVLTKLPHARHLCRDILTHLGPRAVEVVTSMSDMDELHLSVKLPQWLADLDVNLWIRAFRGIEVGGPNPDTHLWEASLEQIEAAAADLLADATTWRPRPAAAIAADQAFGPEEWMRMTMPQLTAIIESGSGGDATADWLATVLDDPRLASAAGASSMTLLSDTDTRLCDVLTSIEAFV